MKSRKIKYSSALKTLIVILLIICVWVNLFSFYHLEASFRPDDYFIPKYLFPKKQSYVSKTKAWVPPKFDLDLDFPDGGRILTLIAEKYSAKGIVGLKALGNCNVSQSDKANKRPGEWVMTQRRKKERMSENRRNQLNSIGFVWRLKAGPGFRPLTVDDPSIKKKARWDSYFGRLCEFVKTYKHFNLPAQHPELGRWAEEQRQLYGFVFETTSPEGGGGGAHENTYFSAQSCISDKAFS